VEWGLHSPLSFVHLNWIESQDLAILYSYILYTSNKIHIYKLLNLDLFADYNMLDLLLRKLYL